MDELEAARDGRCAAGETDKDDDHQQGEDLAENKPFAHDDGVGQKLHLVDERDPVAIRGGLAVFEVSQKLTKQRFVTRRLLHSPMSLSLD